MGLNLDFALRDLLSDIIEVNGYILEPFFARKGGRRRGPPQPQPRPPGKRESRSSEFTRRKREKISTAKRKCKLDATLTKLVLLWVARETSLLVEVFLGKCIEYWEVCRYKSTSFCARRWVDSQFFFAKCEINLRWVLIKRGLATMSESRGNNSSIKGSVDLERRNTMRESGSTLDRCSEVGHLQVSASTSTSPASSIRGDHEYETGGRSSLTTVSSSRSAKQY